MFALNSPSILTLFTICYPPYAIIDPPNTKNLLRFFIVSTFKMQHLLNYLTCTHQLPPKITPFISSCKIYCSLRDNPKYEVRYLFNLQKYDVRSTFGRNCLNICREREFPNIESMNLSNLTDTPNEAWCLPFIK